MGRPATLRVDIVTNAKGQGVQQADSRLGKFGARAAKVGAVAGGALAAVGAAAVAVGVKVAQSASRQEQAYGALDSIYGRNAAKVKAWAKTAASSVGLARSEYAELAALVGAQLQGMGMAQDKSANKSRQLIKVGADLAATFGGSVSDAVGAVSSLLKGETDPIERYGVSIKQADVNARLAAMGLDNLTGKAAKQAQAQATLSLLMEQTKRSTGAFARESNTLAGQQERLKAKFENVKATVGGKLTPVLVVLFSWINDKLFPAASRFGRELGAKLGPIIARVGSFVRTQLVPRLRELYAWFERYIVPSIRRSVTPILNGLRAAFSTVSEAVRRNSDKLAPLVRWFGLLLRAANPVRELFGRALGAAFRGVGLAVGAAIDGIATLVSWVDKAARAVGWLIDKLSGLRNMNPGAILDKLGGIFSSSPLERMVAPLTTGLGLTANLGGLTTAAVGPDLGWLSSRSSAPAQYVDARSYPMHLTVEGALDGPAVARQLERILEQHAKRMGRR